MRELGRLQGRHRVEKSRAVLGQKSIPTALIYAEMDEAAVAKNAEELG